jgi:hypothetical protein
MYFHNFLDNILINTITFIVSQVAVWPQLAILYFIAFEVSKESEICFSKDLSVHKLKECILNISFAIVAKSCLRHWLLSCSGMIAIV